MSAKPLAAIVTIMVLSAVFVTVAMEAKTSIWPAFSTTEPGGWDGTRDQSLGILEDEEYEASRWDWE